MKRYCHPHRSWLAIHLSDGGVIAGESTIGRRKKELYYDRDIRNVTFWSTIINKKGDTSIVRRKRRR